MRDNGQLGKADILGADDLKMVSLHVPEWGGDVYIRTMTGDERDHYEQLVQGTDFKRIRSQLVVMTTCDVSGTLLFSENDIGAVGRKSCRALDRIFALATKLNGITAEDVAELKKNSQEILSGGSSSSLPVTSE